MSGKRKRKPEGVQLSPEMQALVREALGIAGWDEERIEGLIGSGKLDDPALIAALNDDLRDAFEVAAAQELVEAGYLKKGRTEKR